MPCPRCHLEPVEQTSLGPLRRLTGLSMPADDLDPLLLPPLRLYATHGPTHRVPGFSPPRICVLCGGVYCPKEAS